MGRFKPKAVLAWILALIMMLGIMPLTGLGATPAEAAERVGRDYFISSSQGNDNNSGTEAQPWRSLRKVNATVFQPGDRIFFRAGDQWFGQLVPQGFGTDENPITIDMYGPLAVHGNLTDYPAIHGMGGEGVDCEGYPLSPLGHWDQGFSGTLMLVNTTNWTIRHLQITNDNPDPVTGEFVFRDNEHFAFRQRHPHARTSTDSEANTGAPFNHEAGTANSARFNRGMNMISVDPVTRRGMNERNGVWAIVNPDVLPEGVNKESFRVRNLNVENLYIHNVDGVQHWNRMYNDARFQGAILAHLEGAAIPGVTFENLSIYNNVLDRVGTMGIALFDFADHNYFQTYYRHADRSMKNVYIGYNYATNILGGAMNLCNMDGALIEYNVMDHWGRDYSRECAGVYTWQGNNVWYANNIVSNGPNQLRGGADGGAWDIDSGLYNVIHEFNYTYNNPMGTITWLGRNYGSIYRYNIADNDKRALIVDGWYNIDYDDTWLLNNIFYFDSSRAPDAGTPNMAEGANPMTETYRLHSVPDSHIHRTRGGYLYWINNIFYDFGHQGGDLSRHWFFQGFTVESNNSTSSAAGWYSTARQYPHSSIFWNNNFYFANMDNVPAQDAQARLFAQRTGNTFTQAIAPWMMTGPQSQLRNQNNLFMVDPMFAGISGTKNDIPTLPRAIDEGDVIGMPVAQRAPGRPNLDVSAPVLPRQQTIATSNHIGQPFPEQLGRVMNVGDAFWGKFKLQPNSPMIDAGRYVPQMGEYDFFGTQLYWGTAPDLGIYEHTGGGRTRTNIEGKHDIRGGQDHVRILRDLADPNVDTTKLEPLRFWNIGGALTPRDPHRAGNLAARREVTASVSDNLGYFLTNEMASPHCMEWGLVNAWNSGNMEPQWIEIDFGKEVTFDTIYLYEWLRTGNARAWTNSGNGTRGDMLRPHLINYTYSRWDGGNWIPFHDNSPNTDRGHVATPTGFVTGGADRNINEATFLEDRFEPVTTNKLRIDLNEMQSIVYLYQVEVYNRGHGEVSDASARPNVAQNATVNAASGELVFELAEPARFNHIRLISANGAGGNYSVKVEADDTWITVAEGNALTRENIFFNDLIEKGKDATAIAIAYDAGAAPALTLTAHLEPGFVVQKTTEEPVLVAHWDMDNREGDVIPNLASGTRNLTATNVQFVEDPVRGTVAQFGRSDDGRPGMVRNSNMQLANDQFPTDMYDEYTISMWVRADGAYMLPFAPSNGRHMMTLFTKGANNNEAMRADMEYQGATGQFQSPHRFVNLTGDGADGTGQIRFWPTFLGSSEPDMFAFPEEWNHVAFTWDGFYYRAYVNGNLTINSRLRCPHTESARPIRANTAAMFFGNRVVNGEGQFFGAMDDIRMYSSALTQDQISASYMETKILTEPNATEYTVGEAFDAAGLVVELTDGISGTVRTLGIDELAFTIDGEVLRLGDIWDTAGQFVITVTLANNRHVSTSFTVNVKPQIFTGTSSIQLKAMLEVGDVELSTPGNYGVSGGNTLVIPEGRTLTVTTVLNVRSNATLRIEGTLVIAEGGRINNDGGSSGGGTITIAESGTLINNGYLESVSRSFIFNNGTIINNGTTGNLGRFEVRAGTTFIDNGIVEGTRPLNIHRDAIRELIAEPGQADEPEEILYVEPEEAPAGEPEETQPDDVG